MPEKRVRCPEDWSKQALYAAWKEEEEMKKEILAQRDALARRIKELELEIEAAKIRGKAIRHTISMMKLIIGDADEKEVVSE